MFEVLFMKKNKIFKIIISVVIAIALVALSIVLILKVAIPASDYKKATEMLNNGDFVNAAEAFVALGEYKDATEQVLLCNYKEAERLESVGRKAAAAMAFGALGDYSDARTRSFALWDKIAVRETFDVDNSIYAIKEDGSIYIAKYVSKEREFELVEAPDYWNDVIDIDCETSHVLKSDGTVVDWYGDVKWTDIVSIDGGYNNFAALKSDGTVVHYKYYDAKDYGQDNVSGWRNIVAVECGSNYTVGLRSDGTVIATGYNGYGQCDVEDWTDIVAISVSGNRTMGLKSDGTVVFAGDDREDVCDVEDWSDIVSITTCSDGTFGMKANGKVVYAGHDSYSICSKWKNVSVSKGKFLGSAFALKKDGTIAFESTYRDFHGYIIRCSILKSWKNIRQPEVLGFYDFDYEIKVDIEAEKNAEGTADSEKFTNHYGTATTICAHSGCSAFIAKSGDTNCCKTHSNKCGNCKCYIDEDAMYCMRCLENALA